MSHVRCHLSGVSCQVSGVRCHASHVTNANNHSRQNLPLLIPSLCIVGCCCWSWPRSINNERKRFFFLSSARPLLNNSQPKWLNPRPMSSRHLNFVNGGNKMFFSSPHKLILLNIHVTHNCCSWHRHYCCASVVQVKGTVTWDTFIPIFVSSSNNFTFVWTTSVSEKRGKKLLFMFKICCFGHLLLTVKKIGS